MALTKDDIKALKQADDVHAIRYRTDGDTPGHSLLRACKDSHKDGPFNSGERVYRDISCDELLTVHDGGSMSGRHDVDPACFASSIGLKQREAWQTVISLLREGDELKLVWIGGNDNGYLRAASGDAGGKDIEGREYSNPFSGLHHDEVWLRVYRKGKKKYLFYLDCSVCPDNTARMIRMYG